MGYTKKELELAMYLLLDETLPYIQCIKVEMHGNSECNRCDTCMMKQYIKRIQNGELPKITKNKIEELPKTIKRI